MSWARIDDGFLTHPKAMAAGMEGRALFIASLLYASRELTDGFVSDGAVDGLAGLAGVKQPKRVAAKLVEIGLWDEREGGYEIHDYLDYNPSREKVLREREAAAKRVGKWRNKRGSNAVTDGATSGVTNAVSTETPLSPSSVSKETSESESVTKRITRALRDELAAKYPDLDEAEQYDLARNHKSYRNAIDKRLYYRNWMRRAEEFRLEREAKRPKPLSVNLPTWQERVRRLAVEEGRA